MPQTAATPTTVNTMRDQMELLPPAHKVKLEQAHKPPVDAANDHQDQAHFIKGLHKKTSFPLGSFPHWKGGYAYHSIHFGLMTRAPPRSG